MITLEVPPRSDWCCNCNRKLDGRMVSPHWPWDTPTLSPKFPDWVCSYCYESGEREILVALLPSKSRAALETYLASR